MKRARKYAIPLLRALAIAFTAIALTAAAARAEEFNPFAGPLEGVLSYFTPVEGSVESVTDTTVVVRLPEESAILAGMRLRIYRKGEPFLHPVTGEEVVKGEAQVGIGEVLQAGQGRASLRLVEGKAAPGDVVRISSGRVRMLYYQSEGVDWDVSEEYFFWLKDTGRFALAETRPGPYSTETAARLAREAGATVALLINSAGTPAAPKLSHTLVWASNGSVFLKEEFPLDIARISTLKVGDEYFAPDRSEPVSKLKIPYTADLIATGDLDGNGTHELLVASESSIYVFDVSARIEPAFGSTKDVRLRSSLGSKFVWIETADLDRDGSDEILFSSLLGQTVTSSVYKFDGMDFTLLWSGPGFIRNIGGTLYMQQSDSYGGFKGRPEPLDWKTGEIRELAEARFPDDRDIYNIAYLSAPGQGRSLAGFGKRGHLIVNGPNGTEKWKSGETYVGFTRKYTRTYVPPVTEMDEEWAINDRLLQEGGAVYTFKRTTRRTNIKGLGYKKTILMALFMTPSGDIKESMLVDKIKGGAKDFAIADGRLYILSGSFALNPLNLFRGKRLFTSKLYVYELIGG